MNVVAVPCKRRRALDWACAAMIFGWGLVLLAPGDTLHRSPTLEPLLHRTSELNWALIMLAIAAIRFAALVINGRMPAGSPVFRGGAALLTAAIWSQFFIGSLDVSIRDGVALPGIAIYAVLLGCEAITLVRSTLDFVKAARRVSG